MTDPAPPQTWSAYLLQSRNRRRTYIGIALDPERRLRQHNGELSGGARSTRAGRPWTLVRVLGPFPDRSTASRVEHAWKKVRGRRRHAWRPPDHIVCGPSPADQEPAPHRAHPSGGGSSGCASAGSIPDQVDKNDL